MKRILLSNVRPRLIEGDVPGSLFDPFGERFTRGQGVFTLTGHLHATGTHLIAQNIQSPSTVLEYPTIDDFRSEVRRGYDIIGISFWINHTDDALEMCRVARAESPSSMIVLGGHGVLNLDDAVPSKKEQQLLFDYACNGDGVSFMRGLLGERVDAPVSQGIFPRGGALPVWMTRYPPGMIAPLLAGYGCPWGCSFCASSRFWNYKHTEFADPQSIYSHLQHLYTIYPNIESFWIIEEDYFRYPETVRTLMKLVAEDHTFGGLKKFGFITEASIGALSNYEPDELLMTGLDYAFIGYESSFAAEHGLEKRRGDAPAIFKSLRSRGILTNAAMQVGWDFQTPDNLEQDLEMLSACEPTQAQFSRLIPYPGTKLWESLKNDCRLDLSVKWSDYHNYGGSYQHVHLTPKQISDFIQHAHARLFDVLGPSLLRMYQTFIDGYEYCKSSKLRPLREDRAEHYRLRLKFAYPVFSVCRSFAPNKRVRDMALLGIKRIRNLFGPPSALERTMAGLALGSAATYRIGMVLGTKPGKPRVFPCKRYVYDGRGDEGRPFRVEYDHMDLGYRVQRVLVGLFRK
jgi:hypothetical protein